jgi:phosphoribosylformylglycinamidine (FGAM) synthase-like enzyme
MLKATKIVSIFLKDKKAPQELIRSVLQFLKISVNLLQESHLKEGGISKTILETVFQGKQSALVSKHKLQIRKIVQKLLKKFGAGFVTKIMPEHHRKMIAYLEKEKRKKMNKKEKDRILVLMGEKPQEEAAKEESDDSDSSDDEEAKALKTTQGEEESEDSESDEEQIGQSGYDGL